jgi:NTP pyrophosphatase (non-canonical NTP hydrolase)
MYYKAGNGDEYVNLKGWDRAPIDTVWLLLSEEVGELASAIRQYKKMYKKTNLKKERGTDVMMEMGDVFSYLVSAGTYVERRSRSDVGRTPVQDELTKNII